MNQQLNESRQRRDDMVRTVVEAGRIRIRGRFFVVPREFVGQRVIIRRDSSEVDQFGVYHAGKKITSIADPAIEAHL
ncbi:MAG TPA: Mu transposase C-terminal domain-containing protein [Candidatus Binatia bacterium]|nr:Mu transposase C-terminal domain-containing protein [Candidatus Binatia bacterium]